MKKTKKFIFLVGACIFCLFGIAVTINSQARDYMTKETVEKTGASTVYTNSTGTNIWSVSYGATCTKGSMDILVQGLYEGEWQPLAAQTLSAGSSGSWLYSDPSYKYKVYRLRLSGSGRGNGFIQGR